MATIEQLPLEFPDVELEISNISSLGRNRYTSSNARVESSAVSLDLGKASITGVFKDISYKTYTLPDASIGQSCKIVIDFNFSSSKPSRILEAIINCKIGCEKTDSISATSDDIVRPRFIEVWPRKRRDPNPTKVSKSQNSTLNPSINAAGYIEISGIGKDWHESWTEESRYTFQSEILSEDFEHDFARFVAVANEKDQDGFNKNISPSFEVRHIDAPFYIDFQIKAKMSYDSLRARIGGDRQIKARRYFSPIQT
jgi:hypothetical protein